MNISLLLRRILRLLSFVGILLSISVIFYMLLFILPLFQEIRYIRDSIPQKQKDFLSSRQEIFFCLEGNNTMPLYIARQLINTPSSAGKVNNLEWHIHFFLSNLLVRYFNEEDTIILYTFYMPFKNGYGIERSAKFYFHKELTELTIDEIVSLIAIAREPSLSKHSVRLSQLKSELDRKLSTCQRE